MLIQGYFKRSYNPLEEVKPMVAKLQYQIEHFVNPLTS